MCQFLTILVKGGCLDSNTGITLAGAKKGDAWAYGCRGGGRAWASGCGDGAWESNQYGASGQYLQLVQTLLVSPSP